MASADSKVSSPAPAAIAAHTALQSSLRLPHSNAVDEPSEKGQQQFGGADELEVVEVGLARVVLGGQCRRNGLTLRGVGQHGDMAGDEFDDNPLEPAEQLDSDEVRNDDGDEVVAPPQEWIEAKDDESLDERLSEEVPDVTAADVDPSDADPPGSIVLTPEDELDRIDPQQHGREQGQIDGTPEDGDSFFDVVE